MPDDVVLLQFLRSPYNEKARWALAHHGIAHRRRTLLPGPHALALRGTGQTQTPVLRRGEETIAGSAAIVRALDEGAARPLVPREPRRAAEASALEARFDDALTPRMRALVLHTLLETPSAWVATFAEEESAPSRAFYRGVLTFAGAVIRRKYGLNEESAADGACALREALELVAEGTRATGYLVGDSFTVADLTAASSLAMVLGAAHPDMTMPEPRPPRLAALVAELATHPARVWLDTMYAKHRTAPAPRRS
jgi:glutathione S-transferase